MKYVSLSIEGANKLTTTPVNIPVPSGVPTGGLYTAGRDAVQLGFTLLFVGGIIFAITLIIYSGIQWIISEGDKQKLQAAHNRLTYAIIGLILLLLAFFLVRTVITILGADPNFFLDIN